MSTISKIFKEILEVSIRKKFLQKEQEKLRVFELLTKEDFLPLKDFSIKIDCFNYERLTSLYPYFSEIFTGLVKNSCDEKEYLIDIRHINTVSASKSLSWGFSFENLFSWGKFMIQEIELHKKDVSYDGYDKCIKYVTRDGKDDVFNISYSLWENTLCWSNSGNSHHFGVAVFYANNINVSKKIKVKIDKKEIDEEIANSFLEKYYMFLAHSNLSALLYKINKDMNYTKEDNFFMFQKDNSETQEIVDFLKCYDRKYVFNFHDYLQECVKKQKAIKANMQTEILKASKDRGIINPKTNKNVNKLNFLSLLN